MDKSKIIKLCIIVLVAISAVVYYFSNTKDDTTYDDMLLTEAVAQNTTPENSKTAEEETTKIKVYVTGEVNIPGVIELEEGARIEDAIKGAGGIKAEANLKDINLAYEVSDGEKIYIPNLSEIENEDSEESNVAVASESGGSLSSNSNGKININKATVSELTSVPGIGESTAQKIITYRDENGKFKAIEDIKNVSGIGDSKYNSMKDYISVK